MPSSFLSDLPNEALVGYTYVGTITSDTTTNGTGVDMQLTDGPISAVIAVGNYGDASTTLAVTLTESDTSGGSYTAISGTQTKSYAASATANDNSAAVIKADKRSKRWVRAELTTAGGGTPSVPVAVVLMGRKKLVGGAGYQL